MMNDLNSTLIEGTLTDNPAFDLTGKGVPYCKFTIASVHYYKRDGAAVEELSFFDIETWGKLAEDAEREGRKGRRVRVVGRLKQSQWTDGGGKRYSKITVSAEHIEFRPETKKEEPETKEKPEKA